MKKKFLSAFSRFVLIITVLVMASSCCMSDLGSLEHGGNDGANGSQQQTSSFFGFDKEEIIKDLKRDLLSSINEDLIQNISESKLGGPVNAVITLSSGSLVSYYNSLKTNLTLDEFLDGGEGRELTAKLTKRQNELAAKLKQNGLIGGVKFNYSTILDGIYVSTTYDKLQQICDYAGVSRVMVSNTYKAAAAVSNPVNVYDTGIFNSSDVSYTGKGTIVAVLDTGCDYTHSAFTTHQVVNPLYNRDDIAALLPDTLAYSYDNSLEAREVYYGNITRDKIVYGYDYADRDPDVMPFASEHGTHVAGIIGGYDNTITGVAIDTQLAIMKVFSDYREGADDGDILAALEDSVRLGVDAINMSLGTSCGFSREVDEVYKNEIYDNIRNAGISLITAASNDYSSAYGSEFGNTNKVENPDSATVGAPSTYEAALSVASINGNMDKYMLANNEKEIYFHEAVNQNAKELDFFAMLGVTSGSSKTYEYVTVPGYGLQVSYSAIDVKGKIALVRRGDISFEDKVMYAANAGAAAIIIYNNVFGDIIMTVGNSVSIPVVSIGKDDGDYLAAMETGYLSFDANNQAGPFMSDFSSWGPTPDLKIKPEITAHGGNIMSAIPGGGYDKLSGTSMASPNMCGIAILIRQYVKDNYPNLSTTEMRDLVNQLCMSTATIAMDRNGNPYSPRKQGAGIADIARATSTKAYLYVDGIDKTKLELGDDPTRSGVYTMTMKLKNLSSDAVSYKLGNYTMTESLSADGKYVAEKTYMLNSSAKYAVKQGALKDGVVTVAGNSTAEITVTITLSGADKAYLNESFANGMYVEGFITFDNTAANGIDLNIPFLAFYGDWSDAPIFDKDYYLVETEAHNNAIDDDDKIKADYYASTPLGKYFYDYLIPMGSYVYKIGNDYDPIPATAEHAALSYYPDTLNGIYAVYTGLLRGAKELNIEIVDTATGKVVWSKTEYNCYKAHFGGAQYPYVCDMELDMADYKTGEVFGDNNTKYKVTMSAKLDWDSEDRNVNDTYSFSFYIDYEAPVVTDSRFYSKYNNAAKRNEYFADITVYDNHYAMSLRPVVLYTLTESDGSTTRTYANLQDESIPIYQEKRGSTSVVTIELTDFLDNVKKSATPQGLVLYVDDYALNSSICYVPFPETESDDLDFDTEHKTLELKIGETVDLTQYMIGANNREVERDYLNMFAWRSDDSCVKVDGGRIEAVRDGRANVYFTCRGMSYTDSSSDTPRQKEQFVTVIVSSEQADNSESKDNVLLESIKFVGYDTLFAFTSDIDYSEIGSTGSMHFIENTGDLSFYPSEKVQLHYVLKPWNLDPSRYELTWTSSNPTVATVDSNGVVTGVAEGSCSINLRIRVDGRLSTMYARCSVTIKSEFIIENRELVAYKGNGGNVVIPNDKGILYIGSFAFCHYNLDNAKDIGDSKYDIDLKKDPIGNNNVVSVVIPEGVETIRKYAFYNSKLLESVTLPGTLTTIENYAFYDNMVLKDINLDNVRIVSDYTFYNNKMLTGVEFANINVIGKYGFAKCESLTTASLDDLRRSGIGAFSDCIRLTNVTLGHYARVSERMFENSAIASNSSRPLEIYSDTIPDRAFYNCARLQKVYLLSDVTYLGNEAFYGCTGLNEIFFDGDCEYMGAYAFAGCTALRSITLPSCELALGDAVFANSGLNRVSFKSGTRITEMGVGVFAGLTDLTFAQGSSGYYYENDILYADSAKKKILMVSPSANLGAYVLPDSVVEIADGAFSGNRWLTSFSVGAASQLTAIGYGAFSNCDNLTTVTLPTNNNIVIGDRAFFNSVRLSYINLQGVQAIGEYAFRKTALVNSASKPISITTDGATIGAYAFAKLATLEGVYLGDNVVIGEFAFAGSGLKNVAMGANGGIVIGESAFEQCHYLVSIDLSKAAGKLGDYAFYECYALTEVDLSNITELGEGCFMACTKLTRANNASGVKAVGMGAFMAEATVINGVMQVVASVPLTTFDLSGAEYIGEYAFFSTNLTTADLSNAKYLGGSAFGDCAMLRTVTFGADLTELNDSVFFGCPRLEIGQDDLKYVVTFGSALFYQARLPKTLNLDNAEVIMGQAFIEDVDTQNNLVKVNAPKLRVLGNQAFAECTKLVTLNAPNLESIEFGVFYNTSVAELELTDKFVYAEYGALEGAKKFVGFYVMDGEFKINNYANGKFVLDGGALYMVLPNGYYTLSAYPMAKADADYAVLDGTIRIEYRAVYGNKNLQTLRLPSSLRYIGNYAYAGCDNLTRVYFNSYYAPVLEGTLNADVEISSENKADFANFDKLYKYDYYSIFADTISIYYRNLMLYYNFVDLITSTKASDIMFVIPSNCEGYDSVLYNAYFTSARDDQGNVISGGETMGRYAIDFIDAVKALPETIDRFASEAIGNAVTAYNALMANESELKYVDDSLIAAFLAARQAYNADLVSYAIHKLYDMDATAYSYNALRNATNMYNGLTAAEKKLVANAQILSTKLEDLKSTMNVKEIDFNKEFSDYDLNPVKKPNLALIISLSCVGGALVIAAAVVTPILVLKKKRQKNEK